MVGIVLVADGQAEGEGRVVLLQDTPRQADCKHHAGWTGARIDGTGAAKTVLCILFETRTRRREHSMVVQEGSTWVVGVSANRPRLSLMYVGP